jgi:hypothetical protein
MPSTSLTIDDIWSRRLEFSLDDVAHLACGTGLQPVNNLALDSQDDLTATGVNPW